MFLFLASMIKQAIDLFFRLFNQIFWVNHTFQLEILWKIDQDACWGQICFFFYAPIYQLFQLFNIIFLIARLFFHAHDLHSHSRLLSLQVYMYTANIGEIYVGLGHFIGGVVNSIEWFPCWYNSDSIASLFQTSEVIMMLILFSNQGYSLKKARVLRTGNLRFQTMQERFHFTIFFVSWTPIHKCLPEAFVDIFGVGFGIIPINSVHKFTHPFPKILTEILNAGARPKNPPVNILKNSPLKVLLQSDCMVDHIGIVFVSLVKSLGITGVN